MVQKAYNNSLVIRGLVISPPLALAPMVGLSHSALRTLVLEEGGVGLLFTEMLEAERLPHDNAAYSPLLITSGRERPLFYQIVTGTEKNIGRALEKLHQLGADGVDLNLGCPAPVQKKQGAGLALARDNEQLVKVLQELRQKTELPISVKIRLGDTLDIAKTIGFCRILEGEGVDLITVHARLNHEKFCRKPRWSAVGELKGAVRVPIIINGGIFTVDEARECLQVSCADGLMLGRGAVQRPWLCADIAKAVYGVAGSDRRMAPEECYFRFVSLLEERFAPERRLGRLKQFTPYFAASYAFGHQLATSIQTSATLHQARQKAADFFQQMHHIENINKGEHL